MTEKDVQIIEKAWGREILLHQGPEYLYKRLFIRAGTRTSLQRHKYKFETNYIISGQAEIWLEDEHTREVKKTLMGANEFFTVKPPLIHRVVAITDLVLQECSTSHIDDVERLEDDYSRQGGRIESEWMTPAFCILAAGKGERVSKLSKGLHKGLLKINERAVISHIIEKIPERFDIIIALGFNGEILKDYVLAAHPKRKFTFVNVDKWEGTGSGPGYSIRQCKEHLNRPFYWTTVDTLILEDLPPADSNWLGVYPTDIPEIYSTVELDSNNKIINFKNKDNGGYGLSFIGLAYIKDYETFWTQLGTNDEIVSAFLNPSLYSNFHGKLLTWSDVGTVDSYLKLSKNKPQLSLEKTTPEQTFIVNDQFIKVNINPEVTKGRIERAKYLNNIPELTYKGTHSISYKLIEGKTLYETDILLFYISFIDSLFDREYEEVSGEQLIQDFYIDKTKDRVSKFLKQNKENWTSLIINDKKIDIDIGKWLTTANTEVFGPVRLTEQFHGDLQFDNILLTKNKQFVLLDWRDNTYTEANKEGDLNYDLAKLLGGIRFNYRKSKDFDFSYRRDGEIITYQKPSLDKTIEKAFWELIEELGIDKKQIELLTSLVYLNMSPLHPSPMSEVLFCEGLIGLNDQ